MKQLLLCSAALLLICVSVSTAYNCDPECQHGVCNAYLGNLTCECYGNWSGPACDRFVCDTADPSQPPCLNDGICAVNPINQSEYMCSCPFGFTGNRCQHKVPGKTSPCNTSPCGGNGTCYESSELAGGYYCNCHEGFYGPSCNFTTNACAEQDCMDRGYCTVIADDNGNAFGNCTCNPPWFGTSQLMCVTVNGFDFCHEEAIDDHCHNGECSLIGFPVIDYSCTCEPGWSGRRCNETFDVCAQPDRCYNGGVCAPDGHYFNCSCPENYAGDRCQYLIDPCYDKPCYNEGRCKTEATRLVNGYFDASNGPIEASCDCVCGYSGEQCTVKDTLSVCTVNPCAHDGLCKIDNSETGFSCECPPGYAGELCDRVNHCARRPCRPDTTLECLNHNDTFVCLCTDGWGGMTCEADIDECMVNPCSNGNCTNEFGGYSCSCDPGWTGRDCDIAVTCDNLECVVGQCMMSDGMARCECDNGESCETEQCPQSDCVQLAGNGRCDEACFRQSCGFDGGDCYAHPTGTNPWENCTSEALCRSVHRDGRCDVECNTRGCLYDGLDCVPTSECPQRASCEAGVEDGTCDSNCNTEQCPYDAVDCGNGEDLARDILVLIILTNADQPFESPWREQFIDGLAELTNALPVVQNVSLLTREQLEELHRPLVIFPSGQLARDILIYKVYFKLDLRYCSSLCPDSAEEAADWIQGTIDNGDRTIGPYGVADAFTVPDSNTPDNPPADLNWLWGVLAVGAIALIFVVALVMVIRKRQRSYDTTEDSEVRRVKAKIWRPESPGSEAGTSRSTPPATKRRKSGNEAGSVLSSKDVTPTPSEEPDKYIADGSKNARMDPQNEPSHVKWAPVSIATGDKATPTVIAQVGKDERPWKKSHLDAVHNPHGLQKLVMDYRNGPSRDANAQGPGGLTPLMLVVMRRQPSHDAVVFPPPRDSSDSGGSDYNDHSALLPAHLTGNKLMGRPTSNSSAFSHDTGIYSSGSQLSPVDSSVTALIEAKVDLDVTNDYGQTALYLACACSRGDYVEQLLEAGANPNIQDNWGQSALQAAIDAAAEGAFMLLVNHPRTDLSLKSDGGITPLIAAVKVVNQFMVKQLLKKNVDIGTTDKEGRTAVHWAAMVDNLEALKLLIRQGPDAIKDAQDSKGQTALFLACREGSAGCVKHLLDCFANATLMDSLEQSPIQIAYQKQHMDIVEMLRSTTQGPFPMQSQAPPPMRGIPNAGFAMPPQYPDEMSGQYPHQLVHPKKSKVKRQGSHARNGSMDSMGTGHTPTYITNMQSEFAFGGMHPNGERHQTFGDLSMAPRSQQSSIQMRNYTQTLYAPTSDALPPTHLPITSEYSKTSPVSHQNGYLQPITPPDSATLKIHPTPYSSNSPNSLVDPVTSIAVSSTNGIDDLQAVALITSMADNPPVPSVERFSDAKKTCVYPETSVGGSMRLQHYPLADHKQSYQSTQHNYPSPPQANSGGGSPASAYPSPPDSNEIQQQTFQGYQYPHSSNTCSPPSLTPSPESREEALARQQFHHEIYVDADHHGMTHALPHHQYMGYPPLESSV